MENKEKKEEHMHSNTHSHEHNHQHEHKEAVKDEAKKDKPAEKPKEKKTEAITIGKNLQISKKHAMYISKFIKFKKIDDAMFDLERVIKFKKVVPFKGEIPHRKGPVMSGRYPINASQAFIGLLKNLKGNCIMNGMSLEKTFISEASASWASRPQRSRGRKAKRVYIIMKAKEKANG